MSALAPAPLNRLIVLQCHSTNMRRPLTHARQSHYQYVGFLGAFCDSLFDARLQESYRLTPALYAIAHDIRSC
jgi:hypothetical protein